MAQFVGFGDGHDGSATGKSGTVNTYAACTGTAGQTVLTTTLSASSGDMILVHQTRHATAAGTWEVVKVVSDAGSTLNLASALVNSYSSLSQAVLIPQYSAGTISGAITGTGWNQTSGGIIALACSGLLTLSGSIAIAGGAGGTTGSVSADTSVAGGTGGGFYGGYGYVRATENDLWRTEAGEGHTAAAQVVTTANGSGGEGAHAQGGGYHGAGGGHAATGGAGTGGAPTGGDTTISGGETSGAAALTTMTFGGGGGGGCRSTGGSGNAGSGGGGGGIVVIFAKQFTLSGTISANGGAGGDAEGDGGSGAGGSILIKSQKPILGTGLATATGGSGGSGGAGSTGRIYVHYLTTPTGTTDPSFGSAVDKTLATSSFLPFL